MKCILYADSDATEYVECIGYIRPDGMEYGMHSIHLGYGIQNKDLGFTTAKNTQTPSQLPPEGRINAHCIARDSIACITKLIAEMFQSLIAERLVPYI